MAQPADTPPTSAGDSPGATIQSFASELHSILLGAQSGQTDTPGGAAHQDAGVRRVADRLQALLGDNTTAPDTGAGHNGVQAVLDRLQQTLAQTLQSYRQPAASPATSVTA